MNWNKRKNNLLSKSLSLKTKSKETNQTTLLIFRVCLLQFDAGCGEFCVQGRGDSVSVHSTETSNTDSGRGSNEDTEQCRQNQPPDAVDPTCRTGRYNGRYRVCDVVSSGSDGDGDGGDDGYDTDDGDDDGNDGDDFDDGDDDLIVIVKMMASIIFYYCYYHLTSKRRTL